MVETARRMGAGAGGTRNISGTHHPLVRLEQELADLHGKEAALRLHLGLRLQRDRHLDHRHGCCPDCLILSDSLNHASMIEGVRRSGARRRSSATTTSIISKTCCAPPGASVPS